MEADVQARFDQQDIILNKINVSMDKIRSYMFWTFVITIVLFVLPLIASIFIVPMLIENLNQTFGAMGLPVN